jgi:primosomal protein N' (replication factor Y)
MTGYTLTQDQERALETARKNRVTLLHGVTASGKTEVYLRRVEDIVKAGKQAIVLVPEIALTPQTIERFSSRFSVTVLHSRLTPKQRRESWDRMINGEVQVAVGPRSAVFAPFPNLGLIVIDEEHEHSYKQEQQPRYHARDVAFKRSELSNVPVILGTATPSLETFYMFQQGLPDHAYVPMRERIDHWPLPPVELVDMRQELKDGNRTVLSKSLRGALQNCLDRGEQAIILLNRRGYSSFMLCRECGASIMCPNCQVTLTYHNDELLKCHYCGHEQPGQPVCPKCHSIYFKQVGSGTQKAEAELLSSFRNIKLLRMDKDTTKKRGAHADILEKFKKGEGNVLLGTQMIAKGLDFPDVTLVGVLNADIALYLPDFRAGERTFQLMTQVAGRSGRGLKGGKVVIQTYNPEHYAIQAAKDHDYQEFYREEIEYRRALRYPPFASLISLIVSSPDNKRAQQHAEVIVKKLNSGEVLGPVPAPIPRLRGRYRWQILIKSGNIPDIALEASSGVKVEVDVDPVDLL